MAKTYTFDVEFGAKDIQSKDYEYFIETCFKYSKYFSYDYYWWNLNVVPNGTPVDKIFKYEITNFKKIPVEKELSIFRKYCLVPSSQVVSNHGTRKYFICNQQTKEFVLSFKSLYAYYGDCSTFNKNENIGNYNGLPPEDLSFYRNDYSIFFASETHEGYSTLSPNEDEDVSEVINKPGWMEEK